MFVVFFLNLHTIGVTTMQCSDLDIQSHILLQPLNLLLNIRLELGLHRCHFLFQVQFQLIHLLGKFGLRVLSPRSYLTLNGQGVFVDGICPLRDPVTEKKWRWMFVFFKVYIAGLSVHHHIIYAYLIYWPSSEFRIICMVSSAVRVAWDT